VIHHIKGTFRKHSGNIQNKGRRGWLVSYTQVLV
jgi:hypothetical protein